MPGRAGSRVPRCEALYSIAEVAVDFCRRSGILRDLDNRRAGDRSIMAGSYDGRLPAAGVGDI